MTSPTISTAQELSAGHGVGRHHASQRAEAGGCTGGSGVEKGVREGNKAAAPVGGVLEGAIGGVVGVGYKAPGS